MDSKKAQSTLEYAILITVILAGLLAMQIYMKRGYQGRLKAEADSIGEQYSLQSLASWYRTITTTATLESNNEDGSAQQFSNQQSTRTGEEYVDSMASEELWD